MKFIVPLIFAFNITVSYTRYIETKIEVHFSARDNCRERIVECINNSKDSIIFALYFLTDKEVIKALLDARKRGVKIEGIIDKQCASGASSKKLISELKKNLKINIINKKYGIMHHKFAVIDRKIVITGSYNWTFSANNRNYENLVIIKNEDLALEYFKEYKRIIFKH